MNAPLDQIHTESLRARTEIRKHTNEARRRLGLTPRNYATHNKEK